MNLELYFFDDAVTFMTEDAYSVIDKNNVVITGHTRLLASKKLGLKEVPVIVADDLTEAQVKAFRIADNKTSEYAE